MHHIFQRKISGVGVLDQNNHFFFQFLCADVTNRQGGSAVRLTASGTKPNAFIWTMLRRGLRCIAFGNVISEDLFEQTENCRKMQESHMRRTTHRFPTSLLLKNNRRGFVEALALRLRQVIIDYQQCRSTNPTIIDYQQCRSTNPTDKNFPRQFRLMWTLGKSLIIHHEVVHFHTRYAFLRLGVTSDQLTEGIACQVFKRICVLHFAHYLRAVAVNYKPWSFLMF